MHALQHNADLFLSHMLDRSCFEYSERFAWRSPVFLINQKYSLD